jgi:hypothetical protein
MQLTFSVPTRHKLKSSDRFAGPEVSVTVTDDQGMRIVLGDGSENDNEPDFLIERRPRGWLVWLHPDATDDPAAHLFITDDGKSFVIPGEDFGVTEPIRCMSSQDYDAIEALVNQVDEPYEDKSEFIDTAKERADVIAEKDQKNNLFGPDPGEPR